MIKCVAIDDEPLALRQLAYYLEKVPFFQLVACCQSAIEAMRKLESVDTDVLFVDINMPDLNGLEFVQSLANPPMVVFTTAYQEYALDGYRVNAIDYLLKPFGMSEILRAAEKVKCQYDLVHAADQSAKDVEEAFFIKADHKVIRIIVQEVVYVEGYGEYLRIYHERHDKPIVAYLRMKEMEEKLSMHSFMRVHKSYMVNMKHIAEITKSRIVLDVGVEVPIGDGFRERLQQYVSEKYLGKA